MNFNENTMIHYYDMNIKIVSEFSKRFNENPLHLPKILSTDAMAKQLNLKNGTIILVNDTEFYYIH